MQAIELYVRQRKQLRWAVKLSVVLALVIMMVLAANMGLGWAVVKLTQVQLRKLPPAVMPLSRAARCHT